MKPAQFEVKPPEKTVATEAGHTPLVACVDEGPAMAAYVATGLATFGSASDASVLGSVRNATWSGVNCSAPHGIQTALVSNGTSPKLFCPMLENPVSCRRVIS